MRGPESADGRVFDTATIQTARGEVVGMGLLNPRQGDGRRSMPRLRTDEGVLPVHLGPAACVERQDVGPELHATAGVTGSRAPFEGEPILVAAAVGIDGETLPLRDACGVPLWHLEEEPR